MEDYQQCKVVLAGHLQLLVVAEHKDFQQPEQILQLVKVGLVAVAVGD
jgi:putative N-acetylmannosamine-6-phosphate epimerase